MLTKSPLRQKESLYIRLFGLLVVLLTMSNNGWSQQIPHSTKCGHLHMHQKLMQHTNPALKRQIEHARRALENKTVQFKKQQARQSSASQSVLTIPIVFHVVHDGGIENISDAQIIESVKQLNEDFSATNPGVGDVINEFKPLVANVGLKFVLAQKDPNGNPTTGITRTRSSFTYNGGNIGLKQLIRWPRNMYLNVWVVRSSDGGNGSGFAFYPSGTVGTNAVYDGVVVSHWAVGRTGTAASTHYKLLTHEVGHWANLKHIWGGDTSNGDAAACNDDDDVSDTPNSIGTTGCELAATSCGSLDNNQNYMDYGTCSEMFTEGQKTRMLAAMNSSVGERNNLWTQANLDATLYSSAVPRLLFAKTTFSEGIANSGSIDEKIALSLLDGATFSQSSGTLSPSLFSVSGLPTGLSAQITILSSTSAELAINGTATSHAKANSINNIEITFNASAFGINVSNPTTSGVGIDFLDPYQIVYEDISDLEVTTGAVWNAFNLDFGNAAYGAFYNASSSAFQLETYQKAVVCAAGTRNITPLSFNTLVGAASQWEVGGAYPDLHNVSNATYTVWNGQTAYVGIRFSNAGNTHYGWIKFQVAADGQSYKVLEHAYHEQPNAAIRAGQTMLDNGNIAISRSELPESTANNGAVNQTVTLSLLNGVNFSVGAGALTAGTHFTVANVPAGLTTTITVTNASEAILSFTGVASSHAAANSVSDVQITLQATALSSSNNLTLPDLSIDFIDPYQIVYVDIEPNPEVNTLSVWASFNMGIGNAVYGIFYNAEQSSFQLETYTKAVVCDAGTNNITPLAFNTIIGASSQWKVGDAYPDLHAVTNASYTTWNGQTAYVGIRFSANGNTHYGWLKLQVAANGQSYKLLEYAYNEAPGEPIKAGNIHDDGGVIAPLAAFSANLTTINAGQSVSFTDQSSNAPTAWAWTFAGGSPANSSAQNPQVTYSTPGTYAVTLTATNAGGSNTLTKTAYITVNTATGCNYCTATSNRSDYEHIAVVKSGDFTNTSGASNYTDFTGQVIELKSGEDNTIELTPGYASTPYDEHFKIWIDYNGDCDFDDAGELVYTSGGTQTTVIANIAIAAGINRTTRMRIAMKYNGAANSPCGSFPDGEVEDYTVNISEIIDIPAPDYCTASAQQTDSEHITQVQLGSINNTSASSGYADYTTQSTTMTPGQSYALTVTPSASWSSSKLSVWVDWNRDGDFDDSGEATVINGSGPYNINLNAPVGAASGDVRMRIRLSYGTSLSTACGDGWTGEVEDYTINISGASGAQAGTHQGFTIGQGAQAYPNPSINGNYTVAIPVNAQEKSLIRVFNMRGKLVKTKSIEHKQANLSLQGLPKGLYQMQITNGTSVYTKTLIYQ
ncbi:GEVED domain-containing protein [uncultured Microscilla sp.]|uniref:GEVED domain-containing protein n=1 Tax=uncultured Microscilla sp. TaxID=432653 RepID=UPI00262D0DE3|nr:GEVED domain-containing protein [uncultured Microscilla sp.]